MTSTTPNGSAASLGQPLPVRIAGLGAYLPEHVVTNDDLARVLDTSDEWITTRTGIRQRHYASAAQATSDLAYEAAVDALKDADILADQLGAIVVATCTPDQPLPSAASLLGARLGVETAALDVNAACSGFVYGLQVAGGFALSTNRPVLLVGAETLTRIVDHADRSTAVLFGDGAGAAVLVPDATGHLGPFDLGSDGRRELLQVRAGGSRNPASHTTVAENAHVIEMQGGEVYRNAVTRMAASSLAVLDAAGLTVDDVDLFVGHQANQRILDAVAKRVGITDERAFLSVALHGNTSAASIPLALAAARDAGRLEPASTVLLTAFGAGLTWASCLLDWK